MITVGERRAVDLPSDSVPEERDGFVPKKSDDADGHHPKNEIDALRADKTVHGLLAREDGAEQDDRHDGYPRPGLRRVLAQLGDRARQFDGDMGHPAGIRGRRVPGTARRLAIMAGPTLRCWISASRMRSSSIATTVDLLEEPAGLASLCATAAGTPSPATRCGAGTAKASTAPRANAATTVIGRMAMQDY